MKIRPVGAEMFHADRHDESVTFPKFEKVPKNESNSI